MSIIHTWILLTGILFSSCNQDFGKVDKNEKKEFISSFESVEDFAGFYITPQAHQGTAYHELSGANVFSGVYSHKAWISGANPPSTAFENNNHRAYPSIQLQKTAAGSFSTPCYVSLRVWLDMNLQANTNGGEDDWFSFATFTDDESDNWARTVLVNLSHEGFIHLQHVPKQGQQSHVFQTRSLIFPQKEWVELKIYLDFRENGYVKVWQNGELVSHAKVEGLENKLSQAHFGLYAPPQIRSGQVYNDDLRIVEVEGE